MNASISDSPLFPLFLALAAAAVIGAVVVYATRKRGVNQVVLVGTLLAWIAAVVVLGIGSEKYLGRPIYAALSVGLTLFAAVTVYMRTKRPSA
jgi:hypothetical protein